MTPTIGSIVHYHVSDGTVRAAIVTWVHTPGLVDLNVQTISTDLALPDFPDCSGRTAVMRVSVPHGNAAGHWSWPA